MAVNKVVYGGNVLIDLTSTTATADKILTGFGAYGKDGQWIDGTAVQPSPDGKVYQDENGYLVLDDDQGTYTNVVPLSVTSNGTYTAPSGQAYSPVDVNIEPNLLSRSILSNGFYHAPGSYGYSYVDVNVSPNFISKTVTPTSSTITYHPYFSNTVNVTTPVVVYSNNTDTEPYYYYYFKMPTMRSYGQVNFYCKFHFDGIDGEVIAQDTFATAGKPAQYYDTTGIITSIVLSPTRTDGYLEIYTNSEVEHSVIIDLIRVNEVSNLSSVTHSGSDIIHTFTITRGVGSDPLFLNNNAYRVSVLINDETPGSYSYVKKDFIYDATHEEDGMITIPIDDNDYIELITIKPYTSDPKYRYVSVTSKNKENRYLNIRFKVFDLTAQSVPEGYSFFEVLGDANLVSSNIASGVSIFGINGTAPTDRFLSIYKGIVYSTAFIGLAVSASIAEDFFNSLSIIPQGLFYPNRISGNKTFGSCTTIYQNAFQSCTNLRSVAFPVCSIIMTGAFSSCTYLSSVSFPICSNISSYAFYNTSLSNGVLFPECSKVGVNAFELAKLSGSVYFPKCTEIGSFAFASNQQLRELDFPKVITIGASAFANNTYTSYASFPECEVIGSYAFAILQSLSSIYFPKCEVIYNNAFHGCLTLLSADFPECSYIGSAAFYGCRGLTNISIPKCETIYSSAFASCSALSGISGSLCVNVYSYAFNFCINLKEVDFSSCSLVGAYAFGNCSSLEYANMPEVRDIGAFAFVNCIGLKSIYFPECTVLGSNAFNGCSSLSTAYLPKVSGILSSTFYGCNKLTSINGPLVERVGNYAFWRCASLSYVSLPICSIISAAAFSSNIALQTVYAPMVKSIGGSAFLQCYSLRDVVLTSCDTINDYAFQSCSSLEMISLPFCSYIGNYAFSSCTSLRSIYLFGSSVPSLGGYTMTSTPISRSTYLGYYGSIFVPESLYNAYSTATNWATYKARLASCHSFTLNYNDEVLGTYWAPTGFSWTDFMPEPLNEKSAFSINGTSNVTFNLSGVDMLCYSYVGGVSTPATFDGIMSNASEYFIG